VRAPRPYYNRQPTGMPLGIKTVHMQIAGILAHLWETLASDVGIWRDQWSEVQFPKKRRNLALSVN